MTGKAFKAFFKARHGTKWAKGAALDLNVSRFTCQRLAIMAKVPAHYVALVKGLKP